MKRPICVSFDIPGDTHVQAPTCTKNKCYVRRVLVVVRLPCKHAFFVRLVILLNRMQIKTITAGNRFIRDSKTRVEAADTSFCPQRGEHGSDA